MYTPIFIPTNTDPSHCPNCGSVEHKVEICKYCKYEYPEEDAEFPVAIGWLILLSVVVGGIVGFKFVAPTLTFNSPSLADYVLGTTLGMLMGVVGFIGGAIVLTFLGWLFTKTFKR